MSIPTPNVAVPVDDLTNTQKVLIQNALEIGEFNIMFASVKTASDHAVDIQAFQNNYVYLFKNDDIIEPGDTISDIDTNSFDVALIGCDYIPSGWYCSVLISGTDAFINRYINFNEINGDFLAKFGITGVSDGQFQGAQGMATDIDSIYICDAGVNDRVQIFDLNGNFLSKFGTTGTGNGQFDNPFGVAVNSSNIFVTDFGNDRVQIFDLSGTYVSQFGTTGTGNGQFNGPQGIDVDDNYIYVVDSVNNRVQIFDLSGTYVSQFNGGASLGALSLPFDITVNDNYIAITEDTYNWLKIYDLSGTFIKRVVVQIPKCVTSNNIHIYVTNESLHRIEKRDILGNLIDYFGTQGVSGGQFNVLFGIALNGGSLFAGDANNSNGDDNIHKFI